MGVCLNKKCITSNQKIKDTIHLEIDEKKEIDINNIQDENEEKQNNLDESELTKKEKKEQNQKDQNRINNNGIINYKIESKFKSRLIRYSHNGHISNNSLNIYNENTDNFDQYIHFTNGIDKKNTVSGVTFTNS